MGQTARQMSGVESDIWGHAVSKALHTKPENSGCPFLITTVNLTSGLASQSCRFLVTRVGRVIPQTTPSLTIADLLKPVPLAPSVLNPVRWGFPCGTSGKESACQCRRCKRHGFNPWVRKIPWRKKWQPTPVFLPGETHQRSPAGYSPWGRKESDTTEGSPTDDNWKGSRVSSLTHSVTLGVYRLDKEEKVFISYQKWVNFWVKKTASRKEFH